MEYNKILSLSETRIPGLLLADLTVHDDARGWFKENWQRAKMCGLGVPDRGWVQANVSYNQRRGATRGIHAEPWDKWVSVAAGSIFGAWVDLREGSATFGTVFTTVLDPSKAVYVPRGIGNSFQALEDGATCVYLVDAHWSAKMRPNYTYVNLFDPDLAIPWPIPAEDCEVSEADRNHPLLRDVRPMPDRQTLVTGANGQLGRAVRNAVQARDIRTFSFTDVDEFDIADSEAYSAIDWSLYGTVINCGAYTGVDDAETREGRVAAWRSNAEGPAMLARVCMDHGITLVHVSSDYVFDGENVLHDEREPFSPLGVYGQTKAAGDLAVATCPSHYIVRSSWVVGDGRNFVRTMAKLSDRCADDLDCLSSVKVVDDQFGRLTFTDQLAEGILWLLGYRGTCAYPSSPAEFGTYNLTGSGRTASWFEVARSVFAMRNGNGDAVLPVSTEQYYAGMDGIVSPRPVNSTLDLSKLEALGFQPRNWEDELSEYVSSLCEGAS